MSAEIIINTLLNSSTGLAELVGQRIYLDTRPEADPLPAIVYGLISNRQDNSVDGEKEKHTARVQVSCFSHSAGQAVELRRLARLACHKKSGVIGGVKVISCLADGVSGDSYDQMVDIYTKPIDFIIHYLE